MFDKCTARCTSLASLKPNWSQPYIIGGRVCALETFPKIVAALPSAADHAALISLPILTTVDGEMHAHAHRREVALPKLALVASVVAVGWVSGARLAQDVVTAPARMSAQPNLPTSVRATLQFGPIYLATGGGRSSRDSSGAVVKSVGCRHGQQET